ncbi:CapA family protein [Halorhabdus amylolytica]|uniref:CapA family protein n=1 Tax=Halorhabdus amylolytica TaxID=2559573 RepID=UPI0010AB3C9E|nr:CapA family protein [Halorhabdus amylolytica]
MRRTRRGVLAAGVTALAGCSSVSKSGTRSSADTSETTDSMTRTDARIGFVGDVMLGRSVNDHWAGNDPGGVWGSTLERLRTLDGFVLNLECCISERGRKWPEKTYYFRAAPDFAVPALRAANASVATLANNHILDFRETALEDTRDHLTDAGVDHAGAGPDRDTAFDPAVTEIGGLTMATIGLTDQYRPYAATGRGAGTAYVPLGRSVPGTRQLVETAIERAFEFDPDLVVASLHWGPNWETEPRERQKVFARWLVERGVDVVHGHSAHVLQGIEVYQGRPIIYDAGDFVDDYIHKEGYHNKRSALFELVLADGSFEELRAVPIEIEDQTATMADEAAATWVRETVRERSEPFGTTVERTDGGLSIPLDEG